MKLRLRDNTLRLRLTRGEVEQLRSRGFVRAEVSFADGRSLAYVCEAVTRLASPSASFDGKSVTVCLPTSAVKAWADTEQVSIAANEALENGATLSLLVEKDFACLKPRAGEDESDMFDHPLDGTERG